MSPQRENDQKALALFEAIRTYAADNYEAKERTKALTTLLNGEHRTHQQSIMRNVLWPMLVALAEGGSDGRNEAAVEAAKTAVEAVRKNNEGYDPPFPYI